MKNELIKFIREIYVDNGLIPLHKPTFDEHENNLVQEAIQSTFVSSSGFFVDKFEELISKFIHANHSISVVNGTAALHSSLHYLGVTHNDLVITQSLTFVATCNAISQLGANPAFVDVDLSTLGMSPDSLKAFLDTECDLDSGGNCVHKKSNKTVKAIVPMHTFGHPVRIREICILAKKYNIPVLEDAAESLGSTYEEQHTGTFGSIGVTSFNGNKIITTGGGGMIFTNEVTTARGIKHLTTTGKLQHKYDFVHDIKAFNYRLPNLNAALGCAQFAKLQYFIEQKRKLAKKYKDFLSNSEYVFFEEPANCKSNYWINAMICPDSISKTEILEHTNDNGIHARPIWRPMHMLDIYKDCIYTDLSNTEWAYDRVVNLPSTPPKLI